MRKPDGAVKKTRTEITIEVDELMLVRSRRGDSVQTWCPACAAEVAMVPPEQAAMLAGVSSRTIYRWVEEARLHFTEDLRGSLLVCADSLPASTTKDVNRF